MNEMAESVAHAFVRAINRQDVTAIAERMTVEHRFIDGLGNVCEGREQMRARWTEFFRLIPDYTIAVEETLCDGPVVVLLGLAEGTFAPEGRLKPENHWKAPLALRAFVEEDKVAEWRVYADNEPLRQRMRKSD